MKRKSARELVFFSLVMSSHLSLLVKQQQKSEVDKAVRLVDHATQSVVRTYG